jgi:sialate O-acetylesterase
LVIDNVTGIGRYYESLIRQILPFNLRGCIWYQGESNIMAPTGAARYEQKMEVLINGWRDAFNEPDMPFYFVQIAPHHYSKRTDADLHPPDAYGELREQQVLAMQIPHTGMIVTTDLVSNPETIHPGDKVDVGERLARWALAKDYGHPDIVVSGPQYESMNITDGKIILTFTHTDGGLISKDGKPLTCFTIAATDKKFFPADAEISGDTVIVSNPQITAPVAVRFGWNEVDRPNLFNGAGLPTIPSRTDPPTP